MTDFNPLIFSFFSGSGFLDLGFEQSGFEVAFVNENHKPFLDAYKYSREVMGHVSPRYGYSDRSIEAFINGESADLLEKMQDAKKTGQLVGFIGGPPCPDFSVGGKNKGKDGDNGRLTEVYVQTILRNTPDFFVFENVKGLWRTKKHREFYEKMKSLLDSAGYLLTDRLTNSLEFGAPQDRDRILLFGVKKKLFSGLYGSKAIESEFDWEKNMLHKRSTVLDKGVWPSTSPYKENSTIPAPKELLEEHLSLTVEYWFNKNNVESHPNANEHFIPRAGLPRFQSVLEGDDSKKSYKRLHRWRYSPTAAYGNNEVHLHPYKSRRLSVSEALSIQSLPKEFVLPPSMTLSNKFKTIGNGVPYMLSKGLAETIYDFLENKND